MDFFSICEIKFVYIRSFCAFYSSSHFCCYCSYVITTVYLVYLMPLYLIVTNSNLLERIQMIVICIYSPLVLTKQVWNCFTPPEYSHTTCLYKEKSVRIQRILFSIWFSLWTAENMWFYTSCAFSSFVSWSKINLNKNAQRDGINFWFLCTNSNYWQFLLINV